MPTALQRSTATMKPRKRQRPAENRRKKNSQTGESSSQTSIADLSDGILTHILSFLPTTAAAQTSAVAPSWRYLWHSIPVIKFNMKAFHRSRARNKSVRYTRQLFAEMLSQSLLQRPREFPVQKFKLSFAYRNYDHIQAYVDSWLRFVIGEKTVELDLDFSMYRTYITPDIDGPSESDDSDDEEENEDDDVFDNYRFHYSDLVNSSVAVLKLRTCDPWMPSTAMPIRIETLREIHLEYLWCWDGVMAHLLASCVNLEVLSTVMVQFMEDWIIESKSLKHFEFQCSTEFETEQNSVQICAPNLESLILSDAYDMKYSLKDVSSLVEADVLFPGLCWLEFAGWTNLVHSLDGVERLTFQNMWSLPESQKKKPEDESYGSYPEPMEEIFSETFVFRALKHVELLTGYLEDDILGLEIFLKKCPQLETLALVKKYRSSDDLKGGTGRAIVLQMPCLKLVEMKNFQNTGNELFVIGLLKEHGVVLEKIVTIPVEVYNEKPRPPPFNL